MRHRNILSRTLGYAITILIILFLGIGADLYSKHIAASGNLVALEDLNLLLIGASGASLLFSCALFYLKQKHDRDLDDMRADFIAVASHELRSPLTAIRWSLAELRENSTLSIDARTITNDLYQRVCSLIGLSTTFLLTTAADQSPLKTSDIKPVNITPYINDAVWQAHLIAAPKKIKINVAFSLDSPITIRADADRLRIVFNNLLSNAIKYSRENSTVDFTLDDRVDQKIFRIHDTGIGVAPGDLKKIFSGYHRGTNAKRSGVLGSGFGLYMTKKIVDFHRGTITCESKEGEGTTFIVSIPSGT